VRREKALRICSFGGEYFREEVQGMLTRYSNLLNKLYALKSEDGQTTVEYAVVLVLVVVMAIAVFAVLQGGVSGVMTDITNKLTALLPSSL
jgi:Flp pilus assembly pilin Flp